MGSRMILYTEKQLQQAYDLYRVEHMKLGLPMTNREQFRVIFQHLLDMVFAETFESSFPIQFIQEPHHHEEDTDK